MEKDISWKQFLSDDSRYADLINGLGCGGRQAVAETDLYEADTQTGLIAGLARITGLPRKRGGSIKIRDTVRKVAFGVNFAVIGIESQENTDYGLPLRNLLYDAGDYQKQAVRIRKEVKKESAGLTPGEFLYGFRKDSRLNPVITFILYTGAKEWDGPRSLHDILAFNDIPAELSRHIPDYAINLIEVRKLTDTGIFRTDVKQVFDFIRYAENKTALASLVEQDPYFKEMEEDAYDVVTQYTHTKE